MNAPLLRSGRLILLFITTGSAFAYGFTLEPKSLARTSPFHRPNLNCDHLPKTFGAKELPVATSQIIRNSMCLSGGAKDVEENNNNDETSKLSLRHELVAEFIGTFMIVQFGCGTVCSAIYKSAQVGLWQIAAVWSIAVTLAISATAAISGAHLNPAITIALALLRGFQWTRVLPFILAQLGGAVAAAGVNMALFHDSIASFEATNNIVRGTIESVQSASAFGEYWSVSSWTTAFFAEAYGTAMLAFVIFALTNERNETTSKHPFLIPPLIGATVGGLISVIAPLTQAGFNPARDFGPRIIAKIFGWKAVAMKGWWLYVLAPIVGAPFGAFLADKVLYKTNKE